MDLNKILLQLSKNKFIKLSETEYADLVSKSILIEEMDTLISDHIRIFDFKNQYFVQEFSKKNEILLRKFNSLKAAKKFVNERLNIYDKMWDGCGCKVNYYD